MAKKSKASPLFILAAMLTALAALYFAREILLPIALAILLSFLLTPLADRLERWGFPRALAVVLVVFMSFAVLGGLGWVVTDQLVDMSRKMPGNTIKQNLANKTQWITSTWTTLRKEAASFARLRQSAADNAEAKARQPGDHPEKIAGQHSRDANTTAGNPLSPLETTAAKIDRAGDVLESPAERAAIPVKVVDSSPSPFELFHSWMGPVVAPFATAFIVIILTLFMLLDREGQRARLIQLFGRSHFQATTEAVHDVSRRVGQYLRTLFVVNAGYGMVIAVGLAVIGVPSALLWGVLAFAMRFLPYLGPWIAATPPIVISIITSDGWTQPLIVFAWFIVVEVVVYNFIEPFVYGSIVGVSTVGIFIAALFWTWLWGPVGLVLAMPMTVCLLVAARYVPHLRFLTVLLADEPPQSPAERVYQRLLAYDYREPLKMARLHLKELPLAQYYDEVLIPALRMSEHDRHAAALGEDQSAFVIEAAEDLVEELGELPTVVDEQLTAADAASSADKLRINDADRDTRRARVLCVPLLDDADEVASRMLAQLLLAEGFDVDLQGAKRLTSEVVDRVSDSASDIVVISVLPPLGERDSRLLWKRLRGRYPKLPIVVGYWSGSQKKDDVPAPDHDPSSKIATTLAEAVAVVRAMAAQRNLAVKTAS
jgi:predicted PurR-regulated permease PerM/methylmalonyl-CoA mutase cobalamin-binding subunit